MSDEQVRSLKFLLRKGNFTQVPNEMLEYLMKKDLTPTEFKICLFLIRELTGWDYQFKPITIAQFSLSIEVDEKEIIKALKSLVENKNVLLKRKVSGYRTPCYGFNADDIGRVLIGEPLNEFHDGEKIIDLKSFKLLKVSKFTLSKCQKSHLKSVKIHTQKNSESATRASKQASKYPEIHSNTFLKEENEKKTANGSDDWTPPPNEVKKLFPQFFKREATQ